MSAIVNLAFAVRLKHKARNIESSAVVIAETDVDAIEAMKTKTLNSIVELINSGRNLNKTNSYTPPENFWDGVEVEAEVLGAQIMKFEFDRIQTTHGFILR